jgi:hypothetical protein
MEFFDNKENSKKNSHHQAKIAHTRVRMEGWRQRWLGETEKEKIMATEKTLARDRPAHGRTWAHVKLP